uniref:Uncharacterized protein n=1 Tax=Timema genevievae TaxID=629358 RepID=A0A7R9PLF5_TIMGE|nr:unnamed protein product [Timema genevievae]
MRKAQLRGIVLSTFVEEDWKTIKEKPPSLHPTVIRIPPYLPLTVTPVYCERDALELGDELVIRFNRVPVLHLFALYDELCALGVAMADGILRLVLVPRPTTVPTSPSGSCSTSNHCPYISLWFLFHVQPLSLQLPLVLVPRPTTVPTAPSCSCSTSNHCPYISLLFLFHVQPLSLHCSCYTSNHFHTDEIVKSDIWFHFKEGFSNAVRRSVKMKDLC